MDKQKLVQEKTDQIISILKEEGVTFGNARAILKMAKRRLKQMEENCLCQTEIKNTK